jgi:hypothetical protein
VSIPFFVETQLNIKPVVEAFGKPSFSKESATRRAERKLKHGAEDDREEG